MFNQSSSRHKALTSNLHHKTIFFFNDQYSRTLVDYFSSPLISILIIR